MKTIQVSDETYEFLINLSNEIKTQDNRSTRPPYFFQIQENEVICVPDGCGDEAWVCDGTILRTEEDIKEAVFEWKDWELGNEKNEKEYSELSSSDIDEIMKENYRNVNVDVGQKYSNCFFTAKACEEHIKANLHNLSNPVSYLHHAYRNREMEMIFKFLNEIAI